VAGRARVWFEIRHEDEGTVLAISERFLRRIQREAGEIGVGVSIAGDEKRTGTYLDPGGVALVLAVAADLGLKVLTFKTITGHDALAVQKRIPASLIFVPSRGGLSHNPREFTPPEALDKGFAVLVEVLWRMVTAKE
jgi:beta-ureidopropionase / N-carbamoyl-L-amino-acid hydrolase